MQIEPVYLFLMLFLNLYLNNAAAVNQTTPKPGQVSLVHIVYFQLNWSRNQLGADNELNGNPFSENNNFLML